MSSGFISETELAEQRKVRQEEWEKVRQAHDPKEAPEEEYDHRSLYERLEEQKKKKEFEYEESHRLKNMIKGLDDDEVDFLDLVDRTKMEEERKKAVEEEREIADFRNRVATLQEQGLEQRIQQEIRQQPLKINNAVKTGRTSQTKLLAGAVVKKRPSPNGNESAAKESPACKRQREDESTPPSADKSDSLNGEQGSALEEKKSGEPVPENGKVQSTVYRKSAMSCVAILPGLGTYDVSSDESDASTDVEEPPKQYDLAGRPIKHEVEEPSANSNNK
uniref:Protein FAM192A n=1 Tax=Lygus hesperus TaxID=30085 RepID=A0A146LBF8_LYGHE